MSTNEDERRPEIETLPPWMLAREAEIQSRRPKPAPAKGYDIRAETNRHLNMSVCGEERAPSEEWLKAARAAGRIV